VPDRPSVLVVVQRYGDVSGGAEAHARELVAHLRPHADLAVATTTAADYWTWENAYTAGIDEVDGVTVHRFPVESGRTRDFRLREHRAFQKTHALSDENAFVRAQGPVAPELLEHLRRFGRDFDAVLFFTYIYYPTVYGLPLVPERAILIPTAHDEPALRLSVYRRLFHAPRAIAFNSVEERQLVHRTFANQRIPSEIAGVGVDVPAQRDAARFRARFGIEGPYVLYLGRIVESKGCGTLFDQFLRWQGTRDATPVTLVLAGRGDPEMPVPSDPRIRHVGPLSDQQKFDALAAATALVMPEPARVALDGHARGLGRGPSGHRGRALTGVVVDGRACGRRARVSLVDGIRRDRGAARRRPAPRRAARSCRPAIRGVHLHVAGRGGEVPRPLRRGRRPQLLGDRDRAGLDPLHGHRRVQDRLHGTILGGRVVLAFDDDVDRPEEHGREARGEAAARIARHRARTRREDHAVVAGSGPIRVLNVTGDRRLVRLDRMAHDDRPATVIRRGCQGRTR